MARTRACLCGSTSADGTSTSELGLVACLLFAPVIIIYILGEAIYHGCKNCAQAAKTTTGDTWYDLQPYRSRAKRSIFKARKRTAWTTKKGLGIQVPSRPYTPDPPKRFHRFADLPAEIRILIWQHALPGPRVIELKDDGLQASPQRWTSPAIPPAVLYATREARSEARRYYVLAFNLPGIGGIWIDFDRDVIFLDSFKPNTYCDFVQGYHSPSFRQIKHLAIGVQAACEVGMPVEHAAFMAVKDMLIRLQDITITNQSPIATVAPLSPHCQLVSGSLALLFPWDILIDLHVTLEARLAEVQAERGGRIPTVYAGKLRQKDRRGQWQDAMRFQVLEP